jgi:LCP family protein required for cell wall assembly
VNGRPVIAALAFVALIAGLVLGTRLPASSGSMAPEVFIGTTHHPGGPSLDGSTPLFVLVLGSDSRTGQTPVERGHSDVMQLFGINPAKHKVSILGFHRDTWVHIPGFDTTRLNTAMTYGGPQLTVKTIERITGIPIDYYVLTSFQGFRNIVDDIGGVHVKVPYAIHASGKHSFKKGRQKMNGGEALAFARNRHDTPNGVFSRTVNQERLLQALQVEFRRDYAKHTGTLLRWLATGVPNVRTDVPVADLMGLALTAGQIPPDNVNRKLVPVRTGRVRHAHVVFLRKRKDRAVFRDMKDDGLLNHSP